MKPSVTIVVTIPGPSCVTTSSGALQASHSPLCRLGYGPDPLAFFSCDLSPTPCVTMNNTCRLIVGRFGLLAIVACWLDQHVAAFRSVNPGISCFMKLGRNIAFRQPQPHSGLQRDFLTELRRLSVTLSVGTPLCPYGIACRRVYGLSTFTLFRVRYIAFRQP